jgi:hypothetical protein
MLWQRLVVVIDYQQPIMAQAAWWHAVCLCYVEQAATKPDQAADLPVSLYQRCLAAH